MTELFRIGERTRLTSRRHNESLYSFLNTSAWPSVERVRYFWEEWFAQYNEDKKVALATRFRSSDNHAHLSAFLELFNFAFLKRAEYRLVIEPPAGNFALDFLASKAGSSFYSECTATGRPAAGRSMDAREGEILEAIDKVPTGLFILGVQFIDRGTESPPLGPLRRSLTDWLASIDHGAASTAFHQSHEVEEWLWSDRGWSIRFSALPTDEEPLEDEGALGIVGPDVSDHDQQLRLRSALDGKASKYGDLGQPLVVVANSLDMQTERDLITALLGDVLWHVNFATREVTTGRKPNGVLYNAKQPRNVALSAVMHGHFSILNFAEAQVRIVHHPFATYPLPKGLFPFCTEVHFDEATGEAVETAASTTVGAFFGLADGWPHYNADPR